ncbi:MAG: hypothetical protein N2513_01345, partial [Deltaproteobacteria bacterium]|nr:hypothetical protein [Deltaproteobacteria bacterium]
YPNLPILENKKVLFDAIVQGVKEGIFGLRVGERTYFRESLGLSQLEDDAVLQREPEIVSKPEPEPIVERGLKEPLLSQDEETQKKPQQAGPVGEKAIHEYNLDVVIPWDRLSDFVRGVVMPLRQEGAQIRVRISLKAQSEMGIKPTTLEHTVRETLRQIGAQVVEESEYSPKSTD